VKEKARGVREALVCGVFVGGGFFVGFVSGRSKNPYGIRVYRSFWPGGVNGRWCLWGRMYAAFGSAQFIDGGLLCGGGKASRNAVEGGGFNFS